ncbi:TIGR00730 family Rossman fold protein [Extensimonas perlucida]|uniref:LOG family protein n=1 Tax=Extensimonas perlucida TaxID=2590786 RepID=UPI0011A9FF56|nr:TIGR00730 family Rossman fold protein [Extensimonas perlucida]
MDATTQLNERRLADAWAELHAQARNGNPLHADANRLAFADPEFLFRRETRGIRFQLELLKPDLGQSEQGIENTIVVFGSARLPNPEDAAVQLSNAQAAGDAAQIARAQRAVHNARYYEAARRFAALVAQYSERQRPSERIYICTGGGPGIMEAANRGAHETGALNIGLNIALPHEQHPNPFITPSLSFKFHYFALRKMHFMMRAKALLAFPGGFGTLDELFEVLTLVQTKKAKPLPIILFGSDYWKRLIDFDVLVEEGMVTAQDLTLFHYSDDPQQAWELVRDFYGLSKE